MKNKFIILPITTFLIILLGFCDSNKYSYSVKEYTLTFEPRINNTDVKTTIEITYNIEGKEPKSDGFKFVGDNLVDSLICSDEEGILNTNIEYLKETRISWRFAAVTTGTKKIKATFILRDFAEKRENTYVIKAPWAGVFRVPVNNANYCIIFSSTPKQLKFKEPGKWTYQMINSKDSYHYAQSPLKEKRIKVQFEM